MKLFDLTGELKKSELLNQELLCNVIKDHCEKDFEVYQQIVNNGISLTDSGHFKSRILSDDFKNSLIVSKIDIFYFKYFEILIPNFIHQIRSSEVLNDLNINAVQHVNKYDAFVYDHYNTRSSMTKQMRCKSLDNLNYGL